MRKLLELAVHCEAATGPDRELDDAIFAAMGLCKHRNTRFEASDDPDELLGPQVCVNCGQRGSMAYRHSPYTASLDAAMTLVPEGFGTIYKRGSRFGPWRVQIYSADNRKYWSGDAPTEALALCTAALRARTSLDIDVGEGK